MNKKWYISALVIIIALLGGVASQEQNQTPNQEIVLQFSNTTVTNDEAQHAIAAVKQQLQTIGVHDINVTDYQDGFLKITYFSDTDVTSIKKLLSNEGSITLERDIPFELPSDKGGIAYNLDVYEIQNGYDDAFHLSGKLGIEHKSDNDRLSNTNPYANSKRTDYTVFELKINLAYKFHNHIGITIDHISHKIPEVRAGPVSQGMSYTS
ncbi:hypothetical protein [Psychroserpens sp.]|uniref:hypothetical protein n=1 Tax=Psychroserpens sp. TaxID=2020870 RepID=UPI00385AA63A